MNTLLNLLAFVLICIIALCAFVVLGTGRAIYALVATAFELISDVRMFLNASIS